MAVLFLVRSARFVNRNFSRPSSSLSLRPTSASSFSQVPIFRSDRKTPFFTLNFRFFSDRATAKLWDIPKSGVQYQTCGIANESPIDIEELYVEADVALGDTNVNIVDGDHGHNDTNVNTAEVLNAFNDNGDGQEQNMMGGIVDAISEHEVQFAATARPTENISTTAEVRASEEEISVVDTVDKTTERSVLHVAHLLGILDHENVTVLKTLPGSADELFSNMSFLMSVGFKEKELFETISMHPSLMALDLDKSLSRVVKWLQKVELDASFLKRILIAQPGLVPLLAKRALQERVKALRELEIPDQDIGILLKRAGCNQLERFLSFPVEKFEPNFTYIRDDIGLRTSETIKLVCSFPTVLLRDVGQDFMLKVKVLKEVFEDSKKAKKVFVHLPELLARKTDALEETILWLKDIVKDIKNLGSIIEANPSVLTHRKSGIEQVCMFLQSLGFDGKRSVSLIAREPYIVECGSDRLNKHVEFLKSKNFNENAICSLMESTTEIFFKSLEKRVAPKLNFLENQGITGESLQKYMKSRPQVCKRSLKKSLNPSLDYLLSLGFEKNSPSLKSALKVVLPHGYKSMQSRVDYIVSLGIEASDVHKMVRETPSILVTSDASLKKRVDFLVKVMRRPLEDVVKCPSFLVTNINKAIMPRLKVFEWLSSKGLLKKFSLSMLVETEEAVFMKRFVHAHPEAFSIYKKASQVSS